MKEHYLSRPPKQKRGQLRVQQILNAAEHLFVESGFDGVTTNAIAAQAHVSIGSLYQFFPNKEAILEALGDSYLQKIRDMLEHEFTPKPSLQEQFDCFVDAFVSFYLANPGFQPIFFGQLQSQERTAVINNIYNELIERLGQALAVFLPALKSDKQTLYATIIINMLKELLPQILAEDAKGQKLLRAEIKRVISAYLYSISSSP